MRRIKNKAYTILVLATSRQARNANAPAIPLKAKPSNISNSATSYAALFAASITLSVSSGAFNRCVCNTAVFSIA